MVVVPLMMLDESFRSLEILLLGWFVGGAVSIVYGIFSVRKVILRWQWHTPDMSWIRQGYRTGILFFTGTIALQAVSMLDKFWLEHLSSVKEVGVYVFYLTLVQGAIGFIHAGLIVFISPKIVKSFQEKRYSEFNQLLNRFGKELVVAAILMECLILFAMPFVVEWVGREVYLEYYPVLYIVLVSGILMVISNHPHTFLYAARKDRYMLFSNISALVVFLLLLWSMKSQSTFLPLYQVAVSFLGTYVWILMVKTAGYLYYRKRYT
jgi:O-antigen/teichoic acid export membrane protein